MCGFVIGAACLAALAFLKRRGGCGHRGYYGGGCGGGGCHGGGGGWGHRGWGRRHDGFGGPWGSHGGFRGEGGPGIPRFILHRLFEHLQATPGQERVILEAIDTFTHSMRGNVGAVHGSRDDVARSLRGDAFDEETIKAAFSKQSEALSQTQASMLEALRKIFEALEPAQRARLADLIAYGPGGWGGFRGPFRTM